MKTIIDFHMMGGPLFMGLQSILLLLILGIGILTGIWLFRREQQNPQTLKNLILSIIYFGSFALVWGILGQGIGIYQALWAIQQAADISPAIIMGGIRISMITPLYGMVIFLVSSMIWYFLKTRFNKRVVNA